MTFQDPSVAGLADLLEKIEGYRSQPSDIRLKILEKMVCDYAGQYIENVKELEKMMNTLDRLMRIIKRRDEENAKLVAEIELLRIESAYHRRISVGSEGLGP